MNGHRAPRISIPALLLGIIASSSAHADRAAPMAGGALAPPPQPAPYSMEIIDEAGAPMRVYQHRGRTYVLGHAGERYIVRITNPTPRRIEAVVSVDGLDAVDGESADLRKRGYVVPPYGEVRIEGFRVSSAHVAAFRFSSVRDSYAGRKGKARNVGVIGVAIFEEEGPPQLALGHRPRPRPRGAYRRGHGAGGASANDHDAAAGAELESAPAPAPRAGKSAAPSSRGRSARSSISRDEARAYEGAPCCGPAPQTRPGLGTEFGERRYSAVSWAPFVRMHPHRPSAVLELRYNDAPGLRALGIRLVNHREVLTRETAVPFPGDPRFARPPY